MNLAADAKTRRMENWISGIFLNCLDTLDGSIGAEAQLADSSGYWMASVSLQHTSHKLLPSSEQFIIGGEGSVRGYPVGTYAGETGYTVTAELHHPIGTMILLTESRRWWPIDSSSPITAMSGLSGPATAP